MSPDDIARLKALHDVGARGTWSWEDSPPTLYAGRVDQVGEIGGWPIHGHGLNLLGRLELDSNGPAVLDLICAAVNAIPALTAEFAALHAKIAELEGERDEARIALNRGRHADEDCPIAAHLADMYARSDDDQDKMHLAMAAYELRRGPFDHPDHFGCDIQADELRQQIESLLAERDAASARVGVLEEALEPMFRIIERMTYSYGYPAADIASDLEIPEKTVRTTLRFLEAMGLAAKHPFFSEYDGLIHGSGYSLSREGDALRLTSARLARGEG